MGHGREYSESVAATVDVEVRRLMDAAHTEAWEILVEYRDVLDALVLELLEKETLNQAELATIFEPITKRPPREVWLSSEQRAVSHRPPVLTPAEQAEQNGHPVVPQDEAAAAKDEHPAVGVVEVPPNQTPDA
jgi:cell division protease FtsH